jgi:hypothetical protein
MTINCEQCSKPAPRPNAIAQKLGRTAGAIYARANKIRKSATKRKPEEKIQFVAKSPGSKTDIAEQPLPLDGRVETASLPRQGNSISQADRLPAVFLFWLVAATGGSRLRASFRNPYAGSRAVSLPGGRATANCSYGFCGKAVVGNLVQARAWPGHQRTTGLWRGAGA